MANTSNISLPDIPEERGLNQSRSSAFQRHTPQHRLPGVNPRNAPGKEREIADRVNTHLTTHSEADRNLEQLLEENHNLKDKLHRSDNTISKLENELSKSETHKNYWKKVKENAELKAQVAQDTLQKSNKFLAKEVQRLERLLSNAGHNAKGFVNRISTLETQIEQQKTEKASALERQTAENAGLRTASLKLIQFVKDLKTAQSVSGKEMCQASNQNPGTGNNQLISMNQKLRMELSAMKAKLETAENQRTKSMEQVGHLNRVVAEATAREAVVKKELAELRSILETKDIECADISTRLSTAETEAQAAQDSLLKSIDDSTTENLRLQRMLSTAQHNVKDFLDKISTLEAEIERQKAEKAQAESKIATLERQIAEKSGLETENFKLCEDIKSAYSKIVAYEARFSTMNLQKSQTEASTIQERNCARADIHRLSELNRRYEENLLEMTQKNLGLSQENVKLGDLFSKSDDTRIEFEKLATETMSKIKEVESENDLMKIKIQELSKEKSKSDAEIRKVEIIKSEAEKKIRDLTDLKAEVDGNMAEFEEKQATFFAVMKETEKKKGDVDKNRSLVAKLRSELEQAGEKEVIWEEAKKTFFSMEALFEEVWPWMRLNKIEESKFLELRKRMWDSFSVEENEIPEQICPSTSSKSSNTAPKIRRKASDIGNFDAFRTQEGSPESFPSTSKQTSIVQKESCVWDIFPSSPVADMETDEINRSDGLEEIDSA